MHEIKIEIRHSTLNCTTSIQSISVLRGAIYGEPVLIILHLLVQTSNSPSKAVKIKNKVEIVGNLVSYDYNYYLRGLLS